MFSLTSRMVILIVLFFAIVYFAVSLVAAALGVVNLYFYVFLAVFIMTIQYVIGPKIVEMTMRVKYPERKDAPWLFDMVADLAGRAKIPTPRVGISHYHLPNAFAFGRSLKGGRVCVTTGIVDLLSPQELRAVLGHEISHLKNRDVLFITFLSVVPLILYGVFSHFLFFGSYSRRRQGGYTVLIGLAAFSFYFLTNLLVLYASRIREYFADRGSLQLGNSPHSLATALYKLVYGAARTPGEERKEIEGVKAFFLNDLSKARREIKDLAQLDLDHSGTIDPYELKTLQEEEIALSLSAKLMELLSTHPNMLKRIKQLSRYRL